MRDPGTMFLGDVMGFGPSKMAQVHRPVAVSFSDTLNEGRFTPDAGETPLGRAALSHPTVAPAMELIGLATVIGFLWYMDKRIRVLS